MTEDRTSANPEIPDALERYLTAIQHGEQSGNYRRNAKRVLEQEFLAWATTKENLETVADLDKQLLLAWAERLKRQVDRRRSDDEKNAGLAASTAQTYHAYVRAFLSYCIERGLHPAPGNRNPASLDVVEDILPEPQRQQTQQQFWTDENRLALLRFVDDRAHEAVDEKGLASTVELRDRAFVYTLAFCGVRIGEVLRSQHDDRRDGLTWGDITEDPATLLVLGKSQSIEEAPLPAQVQSTYSRLRRSLPDPSDDWPVFPTTDGPTLYKLARSRLPEYGYSDSDLDELCSHGNQAAILEALCEHDICPPTMTTTGGRGLLKRLCEDAEIVPDGDHDYLTPHGGRRSVGAVLYMDNPVKAQKALRHSSIEITEQAYSHLDTGELGEEMGELLSDE